MTEMRNAIIFVGFWRPLMTPPPLDATILNYLNDREREGAIIICMILAPPNDPPPPEATILNYLTDRKRGGGALPFVGFWRSPMPQYLTNLMTERGDAIIFCMILAPFPRRHTPNDLNDRERGGRQYPVKS